MALPNLVRERSNPYTPASTTTPADWILALAACVGDLTTVEIASQNATTLVIKPVAGSPNVNQRWVVYAQAGDAPADLGTQQSGSPTYNGYLYIGYAPDGGASTMGNPATDAPLFTGGTAIQNRFSGFFKAGLDASYASFRLVASNEDLTVYCKRGSDAVIVTQWFGAIVISANDNGEAADDRIHGWTAGGFAGLPTTQLTSQANAQDSLYRTSTNGGEYSKFQAYDPAAPTVLRDIQRLENTIAVTGQSVKDEDGNAMLQPLYVRWASGATTALVGRLRGIFPWQNTQSMTQITSGGGATIKGWTLGNNESGAIECFLLGNNLT